MNIHNRFKKIREDQKLTQQKFAEKVSVARSSISSIESGSSMPGNRLIADVCNKFSVNREWLEYGKGEMYNKNYQDMDFAYLLGKFSAENDSFKKEFILSMLQLDDDEWKVIEKVIDNLIEKRLGN